MDYRIKDNTSIDREAREDIALTLGMPIEVAEQLSEKDLYDRFCEKYSNAPCWDGGKVPYSLLGDLWKKEKEDSFDAIKARKKLIAILSVRDDVSEATLEAQLPKEN